MKNDQPQSWTKSEDDSVCQEDKVSGHEKTNIVGQKRTDNIERQNKNFEENSKFRSRIEGTRYCREIQQKKKKNSEKEGKKSIRNKKAIE